MITIREAVEEDVEAIRDIYIATYADHYAHSQYYDLYQLKKIIFDDSTLILVAEDSNTGAILGTGSILYDTGAYVDMVGEFGRLAVHPDGRNQGIGKMLMEARLRHVEGRLHLALVENRIAHPYSQKISASHGFIPVGFLPQKLRFKKRESVALYARHFGDALRLRRNNPRVIPEAYELADQVLGQVVEHPNVIVDDESPAYPRFTRYDIEELKTDGYATLMRFERGRVAHREIFGPVQLHQGLFKLRASHSNYIIAKERGHVVGAVGYTVLEAEGSATIFEVVSANDRPIRFLLEAFDALCRERFGIEYIEVDVSAYSPQMQRTFLELGFLPAAYIPAMAFQKVERLDAIRMVHLLVPLDVEGIQLCDITRPVAEAVIPGFQARDVVPDMASKISAMGLCSGLAGEQAWEIARICLLRSFHAGDEMFNEPDMDRYAYLVLEGAVTVTFRGRRIQRKAGEFVGEAMLVNGEIKEVSATADIDTDVAVLSAERFESLARRRPDIGARIYKNLALSLSRKLIESL